MEYNGFCANSRESNSHKKDTFQNSSATKRLFNNCLQMNVTQRSMNKILEPRSVFIEPEFSEPMEEFLNCDYPNTSKNYPTHFFAKTFTGKQNVDKNCRSQPYDVPWKSLGVINSYKIDPKCNKNQSTVQSPNLNVHKVGEIHEHITDFSTKQYFTSQQRGLSRNPEVITMHNVPNVSNFHFPLYLHNQCNQENPDDILVPYTAHNKASDHISKDCTSPLKQQAKIYLAGNHNASTNLINDNFQQKAAHTVSQITEPFPVKNTVIPQYEASNKFELQYQKNSEPDKKTREAVTEDKETNNKKSLSRVSIKLRLHHFIGSVEQVIRWYQTAKKLDLHAFYETTGTFETVRNGKYFSQRILFIRGEAVYNPTVLQAVFYAIDRELPNFQKGQIITCVGRMIGGNKLHIFDAWKTNKESQNGIKRASSLCQRILQEAIV